MNKFMEYLSAFTSEDKRDINFQIIPTPNVLKLLKKYNFNSHYGLYIPENKITQVYNKFSNFCHAGGKLFLIERRRDKFRFYIDIEHKHENTAEHDLINEDIIKLFELAHIALHLVLEPNTDVQHHVMLRDTNHIHIHYHDIIVNKKIAKYICKELQLLLENEEFCRIKKVNIRKFVDTTAYNTGLRVLGAYKFENGKWQDARYMVMDDDLNPSEIIDTKHLFEMSILCSDVLEFTPVNENYDMDTIITALQGDDMTIGRTNMIDKIIETINFDATFREFIGGRWIFNSGEAHQCPTCDTFHSRENFYCYERGGNMIIKCYCNREKRILFKINESVEFDTETFDIGIVNQIITEFESQILEDKTYEALAINVIERINKYINRHVRLFPRYTPPFYVMLDYNNIGEVIDSRIMTKRSIEDEIALERIITYMDGGRIKKFTYKVFHQWFHGINRILYYKFTFDPNPDYIHNRYVFNMFTGFKWSDHALADYKENANMCIFNKTISRCKKHLLRYWCQGNVIAYDYLIQWMAHIVQKPHMRSNIAVIVRGDPGTGKTSFITNFFQPYFTKKYCAHYHSMNRIEKFNHDLEGKILVVLDETETQGRAATNKLKGLVTDSSLHVERKYHDVREIHNFLNMILISNYLYVLNVQAKARRWLILEAKLIGKLANKGPIRTKYFTKLFGPREHPTDSRPWIYFLKNLPLNGFNPADDLVSTAALQKHKRSALRYVAKYILHTIEMNEIAPGYSYNEKLLTLVPVETVTDAFNTFINGSSINHASFVNDVCEIYQDKFDERIEKKMRVFRFPSMQDAKKKWLRYIDNRDWVFDEITEDIED